MWLYEKKLQYPAKVGRANLQMAKFLITQYGGADGELAASMRYLTQRYTMPVPQGKGTLTDIGTEELAHLEIIATLVYKLMDGASVDEIKRAGLGAYYADHDKALYFVNGEGVPWTAAYIQSKGDLVTDLHEDMAAEEKARSTYEWLINLSDDPDLNDTLRFLREREIVHFQRFGETLQIVQNYLDCKKVY